MPRLVAVVLCKNVCEYNLQLVEGFFFLVGVGDVGLWKE